MRFVFREDPPAESMPRLETFHVKLGELRNVLPPDTPRMTPEMRKREIAVRQAHIKERWRNY